MKKSSKTAPSEVTDPRHNLAGFKVKDSIQEIESAITDGASFYTRMERNENVRKCQWEGKNGSGRKKSTKTKPAKPWENASDHEVRLAQEVLLQLTAARVAAFLRGNFCVTPMEGTDARASAQMKLVMRYYLETAMRTERLVQAARWASWALRYGHSVLYVSWKTTKRMEKVEFTETDLRRHVIGQLVAKAQAGGAAVEMITEEAVIQAAELALAEAGDDQVAAWLLQLYPQLVARGKEAPAEARRAAVSLRKNRTEQKAVHSTAEAKGYFFAAFILESRPVWEALRQGIEFVCPAETRFNDSFDDARWMARIRWLDGAQLREEGVARNWNQEWLVKVLEKCKGKSRMFTARTSNTPWAMSGAAVGYTTQSRLSLEAEKNLYQIVEYYDRRVTADGVQCLYRTILHPDVPDLVAERELLEDWHGHYPFVPTTSEMDEPMLLENMGIPELVASPQGGIKTQWDSRDDMAGLTTMPPWTGPEHLQGTPIYPGAFIPEWNSGTVQPWRLPPPDGRSIEIEKTLRASVDRYFGLISESVPASLSMLLGQVGVDWFLAAYSRAVALTAQLVQQRMPKLTGARITGTDIVFSSTREDVRGAFDFSVKFDMRALDIEWMKDILSFVNASLLPMDNGEFVNRRVFIEMGVNMIDPALTDRAVRSEDDAKISAEKDEDSSLNAIFSGGIPRFVPGNDHSSRSNYMLSNLRESPMRQQMLASNEMVAAVWEDRLQKHLFQMEQDQNKIAGIQGGSDPLRQSPLARLKAGGWQAMLAA